jgi:NAD(P)-dependent dehydrogenase (short-subunit alcohol dehydrogenase family)
MSGFDKFRYDGKRALVVGGATGMGAAAAQTVRNLGGHVIVMDYVPVAFDVDQVINVDLSDLSSLNAAIDQVDGPIDAIFSAAGIAEGPKTMPVNFIGHRHLIERTMREGKLGRGGAICMISSVAGLGWTNNLPALLDFIALGDYEAMSAWVDEHPTANNYGFAKQVMNAYVAYQSYPFLQQGVRINAILPGPTDTPLARANADTWLTFAQDYRDDTGTPHLTPDQMGDTMVFLNSDAASGISGVTLLVDTGHVMSSTVGSWAAGKPIIEMLQTIPVM